jgi:hypothetical protein
VAATVALGLGTAACTSARNNLGTTNGVCFVALPVAGAAVHHAGHLIGVRLLRTDDIHYTVFHRLVSSRGVGHRQELCLVAYGGRFSRSRLERPAGRSRGRLAVVVVTYPRNHLVVTVLTHRSPTRFGHSHFFSGG